MNPTVDKGPTLTLFRGPLEKKHLNILYSKA